MQRLQGEWEEANKTKTEAQTKLSALQRKGNEYQTQLGQIQQVGQLLSLSLSLSFRPGRSLGQWS